MPSKWSERALAAKLPDEGRAAVDSVVPATCAPPPYPSEWLAGAEFAAKSAPPSRVPAGVWSQWADDALAFLDAWGERAHTFGWSGLDLFGVHPSRPRERLDAMGLVPLLSGRRVVAMTGAAAGIAAPGGGALIFWRTRDYRGPRCLLWGLKDIQT